MRNAGLVMQRILLFVLLTGWAVFRASAADAPLVAPRLINSFERPADLAVLQGRNAQLSMVATGVTEGRHALRVDFAAAAYPAFIFISMAPLDWGDYAGLAVDVTNPGTEPVQFQMRVEDAPGTPKGPEHVAFGSGSIEAGTTAGFVLRATDQRPMNYGMLALPPMVGLRAIQNLGTRIDFHHIYSWQVYLRRPVARHTLIFDNVRLVALQRLGLAKIVDRFGQYTAAEWPGKLHRPEEFSVRIAAEAQDLAAHPAVPERDRFGGWARGPQLSPGPFFRLQREAGKWWLVDPDGHLFLSFGVNSVTPSVPVFTAGREYMFQWLPTKAEPLGKYYGYGKSMTGPTTEGPTYDFLAANLNRKYGPDFHGHWLRNTLARLRSWGFNTIGKTSDTGLYRSAQVPYIPIVQIAGSYAHVSSGHQYWGAMHDPFDPAFRAAAAGQLGKVVTAARDDPWCIGYFVDNELDWGSVKSNDPALRYGLALGTLKLGADASPAKQAFVADLQHTYGSIAKFNGQWKTQLGSWNDLNAPYAVALPLSAAVAGDCSRFLKHFALQYFTVVRDELRRLDPHHLYLGCRFAGFTPESVEAAVETCDALSFNIYQPRIDGQWDFLKALAKPALIGEFHMGAIDRGMFSPGLVEAAGQQARAALVQDYVRSVVEHPALIGCHWFRYDDEPLIGHVSNGENYCIGLVSITDTPYPELIDAFRTVLAEAYPRRHQILPADGNIR